jgi:hypothetical protein
MLKPELPSLAHKQVRGRKMRTFIALHTFESPETQSVYVQDLTYTIRNTNKMLNALAEVWALQGKIVFLHEQNKVLLYGSGHTHLQETLDETIWEKTKKAWKLLCR